METDVDDPTSLLPDELTSQLEEIESRLVDLQSLIASETEKMHKYKVMCLTLLYPYYSSHIMESESNAFCLSLD